MIASEELQSLVSCLVERPLGAREPRPLPLPRRPLLRGDRRAARVRHEDGRQRPPARQAQGQPPPRLARGDAVATARRGRLGLSGGYARLVAARLAQLAEHRLCNPEVPVRIRGGLLADASDREFTWRDGERTIVFRAGALRRARRSCCADGVWERFELLTTPRALGAAPLDARRAARAPCTRCPAGRCPTLAAALIDAVSDPTLVALGGGRVIDVAKAIAAVRGGRVCAIPTTLSGAEMTAIHRLPAGREHEARAPGPPDAGDRRPGRDDHASTSSACAPAP